MTKLGLELSNRILRALSSNKRLLELSNQKLRDLCSNRIIMERIETKKRPQKVVFFIIMMVGQE